MARRHSNSNGWLGFIAPILGFLFSVSLFVGFVVVIIDMLVATDAALWGIVLFFCIIIVIVTVNIRHRKQEEQLLREREQEAKRLHDQRLAEEERQRRLREQEEQCRREEEERRFRALELADVDNMGPGEFEQYVGKLMERRGYKTKVIGKAGDMGVDVVAQNGAKKYAVQVKRYNQPVSRRAVSDAVAGKEHYGCNAAMVVTNNYFTKGAVELAQSTKCRLVDRDTLADWIADSRAEVTQEPKHEENRTRVESEELSGPQLNTKIDPKVMSLGIQVAGYHIEAGARGFGQYAKKMVEELGEKIKPYLKIWYNAVREMPEMEKYRAEMTLAAKVDRLSQPEVLDAILSGEANEVESGIVWRQKREVHVKNERTPSASSLPLTPQAMTDNTHPSHRQHLAKKQLIEQLNDHPLNQKARELLKQLGEPDYPHHLSILLLLQALAHNPEGVDETKVWKETFPYSLLDLLVPLGNDRETMEILLGAEKEEGEIVGRQVSDQAIAAVQTPQEMLELLAGTLSDLVPPLDGPRSLKYDIVTD